MATFTNDSFTEGGADVDLSAHTGETGATWTEHPSFTSGAITLNAANDRIYHSAGAVGCYYSSGTPASADYHVEAPLLHVSATDVLMGVVGRVDTGANTMYFARYNVTNTRWELRKFVAGVASSLGTFTQTLTIGNSYVVRLDMVGTTIRLLVDGVERISSTDSAIAATGKAGVRGGQAVTSTTGQHLLSFTAADPGGTAFTLTADAGSFAISGTAASLLYGRKLAADAGAFVISGTAASLLFNRKLTADSGSFAISGSSAALLFGRTLVAGSGSYLITGTDASLIYGTVGSFTLSAESGTFSISGTAASLLYSRILEAAPGSVLITGTPASLLYGRRVTADAGAFVIAGVAANFLRGRLLNAASGAYVIAGTPATLIYSNAYIPVAPYRVTIGVTSRTPTLTISDA